MTSVPVGPLELLDVDHLLSDEERAVRQGVRRLVDDTIGVRSRSGTRLASSRQRWP
jgi:hypothetical protein